MEKYVTAGQVKIWRLRISCGIPTAANTHSVCVILTAFPLQQCLYKRASVLRFKDVYCQSFNNFVTCLRIVIYLIFNCTLILAVSGVLCCYVAMTHEWINVYWSSRSVGFNQSGPKLQVQDVVWLICKTPFNSHARFTSASKP